MMPLSDVRPKRGSSLWLGALGRFGSDILTAWMVALLAATFAVANAALIFSGELGAFSSHGIAMMLTTCVVLGISGAVFSSMRFTSAGPDGNAVAVMASAAAGIASSLGASAQADTLLATLLVGLALAALFVGAALVVIGATRLGGVVRFLPYPVIAGFLGATGMFLAIGGLRVGTNGAALGFGIGATLAQQAAATLAVGVAILLLRTRFPHPFSLAATIVFAILLHWIVFAAVGYPREALLSAGWLISIMPDLPLGQSWDGATLGAVDWSALLEAAPSLAPLLIVTVITILLNVSALETISGREADINRELMVSGVASTASGMLGGVLGYQNISRSMLILQSGIGQRRVGFLAAIGVGVLLIDPFAISLVPRPVLGGVVLFLGLQLIVEHAIQSRRRMAVAEWIMVLAIIAITAQFGFAAGVSAGLLLGCGHFAFTYSRFSPVKSVYSGRVAQSSFERREEERQLLRGDGEELLAMHVHGFVFFGTANRLTREIRKELAASSVPTRHLALDFSGCDGFDSSAKMSFERLFKMTAGSGTTLCITGLKGEMRDHLAEVGAFLKDNLRFFPTIDDALIWSETTRLKNANLDLIDEEVFDALFSREFGDRDLAAVMMSFLEPITLKKGDILMRQGELSDALFFLEEGQARVFVDVDGAEISARTFGAGTLIGEIGFVLKEPRTATVTAVTPCRVLRLSRDDADALTKKDPQTGLAFQSLLVRRLCRRIRDKDSLIEALVRSTRRL